MKARSQRRVPYVVMVITLTWLSLWTPACLAMGALQMSTAAASTCDCQSCSAGCLACACVQVSGDGNYAIARAGAAGVPAMQVPPALPSGVLLPDGHAAANWRVRNRPPPGGQPPFRTIYCTFLK